MLAREHKREQGRVAPSGSRVRVNPPESLNRAPYQTAVGVDNSQSPSTV